MQRRRAVMATSVRGIGVDLVGVERVARAVDRLGDRFLDRIYTPAELADCPRGPQLARRLAARFAAKEAALKALGTGLAEGIRWQEIEVRRTARGQPSLRLSGAAAAVARREGIARLHLSLSHDGPFAAAVVVAEGDADA